MPWHGYPVVDIASNNQVNVESSMNKDDAIRILESSIPVFDRAAKVESFYFPERRSMIRNGIRDYKSAVKYIKKELQARESVEKGNV